MEKLQKMCEDFNNWHGRSPPFCPNEYEISLYKILIGESKSVCLFGMTKELINLCDLAIDLNPIVCSKPTIKSNWLDVKDHFDCIIGDGVLNLMGDSLLKHISTISNTFISRVFMEKIEGMKYAQFFPSNFPHSEIVVTTQPGIALVKWKF